MNSQPTVAVGLRRRNPAVTKLSGWKVHPSAQADGDGWLRIHSPGLFKEG